MERRSCHELEQDARKKKEMWREIGLPWDARKCQKMPKTGMPPIFCCFCPTYYCSCSCGCRWCRSPSLVVLLMLLCVCVRVHVCARWRSAVAANLKSPAVLAVTVVSPLPSHHLAVLLCLPHWLPPSLRARARAVYLRRDRKRSVSNL